MTYTRQARTVEGCEIKEIINQRGKYYSVLNVRFLEPSPDYPTPMVSVRLGNGTDSAFAQLRIEEFDNFIRILSEFREKMEIHIPSLRQKEAVFTLAKEEHDKQLAALREFMGGTDEGNNLDPSKIIAMMNAMNQKKEEGNVQQ